MRNPPPGERLGCRTPLLRQRLPLRISATAPLCARRICGDRRRGLPITAGAAIITRNNMQRPLHLAEVRRPAADSPILPGPPPLALRRRRPGSVAEARIIFAAPICYANSPRVSGLVDHGQSEEARETKKNERIERAPRSLAGRSMLSLSGVLLTRPTTAPVGTPTYALYATTTNALAT